jgi:hypothetical protein
VSNGPYPHRSLPPSRVSALVRKGPVRNAKLGDGVATVSGGGGVQGGEQVVSNQLQHLLPCCRQAATAAYGLSGISNEIIIVVTLAAIAVLFGRLVRTTKRQSST